MNVVDLRDAGNEARASFFLPKITEETFFRGEMERPEELLERIHHTLGESLVNGFPPVLSVRNYAKSKQGAWLSRESHFVTVLAVREEFRRGADQFSFRFADPWGGGIFQGTIRIPETGVLAGADGRSICAEVLLPAGWGKSRPGVIVPSAVLRVK